MISFLEGLLTGLEKHAKRAPRAPQFDMLQQNRVQLTPGERASVMDQKAVWHHAWKNNKQVASPAIWKSITPDGKVWYVTNTHRAVQARPTLRGAINAYHTVIKSTA